MGEFVFPLLTPVYSRHTHSVWENAALAAPLSVVCTTSSVTNPPPTRRCNSTCSAVKIDDKLFSLSHIYWLKEAQFVDVDVSVESVNQCGFASCAAELYSLPGLQPLLLLVVLLISISILFVINYATKMHTFFLDTC